MIRRCFTVFLNRSIFCGEEGAAIISCSTISGNAFCTFTTHLHSNVLPSVVVLFPIHTRTRQLNRPFADGIWMHLRLRRYYLWPYSGHCFSGGGALHRSSMVQQNQVACAAEVHSKNRRDFVAHKWSLLPIKGSMNLWQGSRTYHASSRIFGKLKFERAPVSLPILLIIADLGQYWTAAMKSLFLIHISYCSSNANRYTRNVYVHGFSWQDPSRLARLWLTNWTRLYFSAEAIPRWSS